ncbi:MAG: DUF4080 domain-containing protein, partial [Clostridiales bacterium]|nr:DUF4080 domain-containing protein [Clostridiales bacterium]
SPANAALQREGIASVDGARGRPFKCAHGLPGRGGGVRYFAMDAVKEELIKLANSGAKTVKFVDRTFNSHHERCMSIFRFLMDARDKGDIPSGVCFHFEVAADFFHQDTIALLREAPAGLFQMEAGLQSFHEPTLEMIGRKQDLDRIRENIRQLREMETIHLHLDLIAGLPGEGFETFGRSFDQAYSLSPHVLQLGFLKLLHGSRLREESRRYGIEYDPLPPYQVTRTDWISEAELARLALCEDALNRLHNSGRFPETCAYLIRCCAFAGTPAPFRLFTEIGGYIGDSGGMALETYIGGILDFGGSIPEVDKETLRDSLVIDWLQTNPVGVLPHCLQREDKRNAQVGRALAYAFRKDTRPPDLGTRRMYGFGLLYGEGRTRVALADYRKPRAPLQCYPLRILEFDALNLYTNFT